MSLNDFYRPPMSLNDFYNHPTEAGPKHIYIYVRGLVNVDLQLSKSLARTVDFGQMLLDCCTCKRSGHNVSLCYNRIKPQTRPSDQWDSRK